MKIFLIGIAVLMVCLVGNDSGAFNTNHIVLPRDNVTTLTYDFSGDHSDWHEFGGKWVFSGGVVRQISTSDHFPVILRMDQQFSDLDISVDFKPILGRIDASGGLVFRAVDQDNYYIVRANSLENNFRLYTFKNGNRRQIASAKVVPPTLGEFHKIRVVVKGDHIQAYLNGTLYIDHHDKSFDSGYIGLWTKADSVTEFDDLRVTGVRL